MNLVQRTAQFKAAVGGRPAMFALGVALAGALVLALIALPLRERDEAVAEQISAQQAQYNAIMAHTNRFDYAAIDLRRMLFSSDRKPYQQYFAAMNDLRWALSPTQTAFLTEVQRIKARESVAEIGHLGEAYVAKLQILGDTYGTDRGDALVTAASESDKAFRALRDRVLEFKAEVSTHHTAAIAKRVKAAEKARQVEDLIFSALLTCCLGLLAFFVAARRRAMALLIETRSGRATLQAVVGGALDGVIMIDHTGTIELFSPSACKILDVAHDEVMGRHVAQFLSLRDGVRFEKLLRRALNRPDRRQAAFRQTVTGRRWSGDSFPMSLAVSQTEVGTDRKFVLIVRDISDEVAQSARLAAALDDAHAASRAKSDFLAIISHELRTPLNGVLGMASALAAGPLPVGQRDMVRTIVNSGQHLLRLVNDLLDLSQVESGDLTLAPTVFDMEQLLTDTLGPLADDAHDKGLELDVNVEPGALGLVNADGRRLRQIICHLVGNAVKFTEKGAITVDIGRPGPNRLRLCVTDTGIGFDEEVKARLFQEFEQADVSMTRRHGGTGLGLALSTHVVALMKGQIGCDSRPGKGSRFWFQVEAPAVAPETAPVVEEIRADTPVAAGGVMRILCVDDNDVNRRVLGAMLAPLAVDVTFAENGVQAVEAHAGAEFDVILMDLQMPVMDGLEAARRIRKAEASSGRARTRIVAVSANCMPEQVRDCLAAGMDRHVAKPVQIDTLYGALTPSAEDQRAVA